MELLSQLDVANPDHVSVITKEGRVIISVRKDGADVTVGFPVHSRVFDTTPRLPLQQPAPKLMAVKGIQEKSKASSHLLTGATKAKRRSPSGNPKLNADSVREIKQMLADKELMASFGSNSKAYAQIGKGYGVSMFTVSNIAKGLAWRNVTI